MLNLVVYNMDLSFVEEDLMDTKFEEREKALKHTTIGSISFRCSDLNLSGETFTLRVCIFYKYLICTFIDRVPYSSYFLLKALTCIALRHSVTILDTSFTTPNNFTNYLLILKLLTTNRSSVNFTINCIFCFMRYCTTIITVDYTLLAVISD